MAADNSNHVNRWITLNSYYADLFAGSTGQRGRGFSNVYTSESGLATHQEVLMALWLAAIQGEGRLFYDQWNEMHWKGTSGNSGDGSFILSENLVPIAKKFPQFFQKFLRKTEGNRDMWVLPGCNFSVLLMQMLDLKLGTKFMHYLEVTEIDKPYPDALEDFSAKNSIIHQNIFGKLKYFDGEKDFAHFIKTGIDISELASGVTRFRGMSDGSFEIDTCGGWAFTIWEGDKIVYYASGSCDVATSPQAEIVGYAKLIYYLVVQELRCPAITDYQPTVTSLEDSSVAPNEIRDAICFIKGQLKDQTIQPCWTPREYNHPTDLLAEMGRLMSKFDYDVLGYDVTWSVELLQRIATFIKFDLTYEHMDFNPAILKTVRILRLKRDVEQIKINHFYCLSVDKDSKHKALLKILNSQGARKVIVYVKNLNKIKVIIQELGKGKILAKAIHKDVLINKEKRSSITSEFSKGECGVLISCVMPYDDLFKVPDYDTFIYFDRPGNEDVYIESLKTFGTHIKIVSIVAPYESKKWTETMEVHGMSVIECDV